MPASTVDANPQGLQEVSRTERFSRGTRFRFIMAVLKLTLLVFAVTLVSTAGVPSSLRRGAGSPRSSAVTGSSTGVAATGSPGLPKPAIDVEAQPKDGQLKSTTDVESQQKDENETSVELKRAGSTGPSDATVLRKAATAHQARLSQRAKEELAAREKAREAALEERTKRDKAGDKPRQFDPKKDKVTHTIAHQVPDIETCGVRHCKGRKLPVAPEVPKTTVGTFSNEMRENLRRLESHRGLFSRLFRCKLNIPCRDQGTVPWI